MKLLIGGFGTRGDVQPMLALAVHMQSRGHDVVTMGPPDFQGLAEKHGLRFAPVGEPMGAFLERISDGRGGFRMSAATTEIPALMKSHFSVMEPLVAAADVIVASSLTVAPATLAEKFGKRFHYVAFCPQAIPSGEHPLAFMKSQTLPRWLNRLTFAMGTLGHQMMMRKVIDGERARLGLGPVTDAWGHILFQRLLLASEPSLVGLPGDLPKHREVVQTGAFFMPEPDALPADIAKGAVFAGFGSMLDPDAKATVALLREAAQLAQVPLLLGSELGVVPHGKLFPLCRAVIHHGGAGTTATAARAGVPQVVVPHVTDQFYWGHHVHRLGLAPKPMERTRLTAQKLADSIRWCLDHPQPARDFAHTIKGDGVAIAARVLEG